ncbi:carboxymuconolactone decarboxylase family protein [Bacillus badius]|uniref:carboxymuconolactone decarboxylase family protein n=1 Tax=Bacillus badius TaxID=1455 RepID=UPI0005974E2C|nr:carboxymuconolactone decarboxylase family protein [Bacillus badius]MED4716950.1 carboxymuconolactone decarboxylase family protein [Bacillus badius]
MRSGLAYFKEVYDTVPGWVQKMHDYSPESLECYTNLRGGIMSDSALTRKEKDILLVGMNAARLYERSMLYHTKGAIDAGATIPELVEYLMVPYLYNGAKALNTAMKSLEYALSLQGKRNSVSIKNAGTMEELLIQIIQLMDGEDTTFIEGALSLLRSERDDLLIEKIMDDAVVSRKMKQLLMVGIFITELKGQQAGKWMKTARENGASEEELADVGFICLLTAGIPAWFEASDSLAEK